MGWHWRNSIRIAWLPERDSNNTHCFAVYVYEKGIRTFEEWKNIQIQTNEIYNGLIAIEDSSATVWIGNEKYEIDASFPVGRGWGYFLYPYFGGDNTAPNDMVFHVNMNLKKKSGVRKLEKRGINRVELRGFPGN